MDSNKIYKEAETILSIIDYDEFSEIYDHLSLVMDEDEETVTESAFDLATALVSCDGIGPLPKIVVSFVEKLYMSAFEEGNADAMNDLGAHYYDGSRGFPQDFTKAVECYKLAAENGSRQAQENLGYCYYYGRNMPVDFEKAFHYFALGAFDGHLISLYKIGDMYLNGYYVKKNEVEAFHIFSRCMDTMTDEAAPTVAGPVLLRLGKCFLYGTGTEINLESALICFQKAELFLYDMVKRGNFMYKKSLEGAISGQAKAREKMAELLPQSEWRFDK